MIIAQTLGQRIRAAREAIGLSQSDLARRADYCDDTAISHIESGRISPSIHRLQMIAHALGVDAASLFESRDGIEEADEEQKAHDSEHEIVIYKCAGLRAWEIRWNGKVVWAPDPQEALRVLLEANPQITASTTTTKDDD